MSGIGPVEAKVTASASAAAVAGAVVWALRRWVFPDGVPEPVLVLVMAAVPAGCAFAAGWWTRHTERFDKAAAVSQHVAPPRRPRK